MNMKCAKCGILLRVPESGIGKAVRGPKCQATLVTGASAISNLQVATSPPASGSSALDELGRAALPPKSGPEIANLLAQQGKSAKKRNPMEVLVLGLVILAIGVFCRVVVVPGVHNMEKLIIVVAVSLSFVLFGLVMTVVGLAQVVGRAEKR
jgi:hypothetical protein